MLTSEPHSIILSITPWGLTPHRISSGVVGSIPYDDNHCTTIASNIKVQKRMLRAILNKSWRQHSTRHQLYGHLPPITKTIQVRRTRHAGHCWRSRDELISDVLLWTLPHMAVQKQDNQHEHTFSNYVRIRDVVQKTCVRR